MFKKSPSKGSVPSTSKSKKSSNKDKERKKLVQQNQGESSTSTTNHEKYMSNQISNDGALSYAGFSPETISIIAEQFLNIVDLPTDVCEALAEDISFRIRELLNAANTTMRLAKRTYLKCDDVDSAFKRLNLEPVYGASLPNWVTFGDPNNYTCILTKSVDLVSISQADMTVLEPGDMGLEYKWLKDTLTPNNLNEIDETLKRYCDTIMKYSISKKENVRRAVLKDVAKNHKIGPIIPSLCNFCFLILQKNITYSYLASPVLHLLEAILFNPCSSFSAEEKQITLLIYLLLQSIMNASNIMTCDVYATCRILGRMCICWNVGGKIVVDKIAKHLPPEPQKRLTTPVISVLTFIGNDALNSLLWPHITQLFNVMNELDEFERTDLNISILNAASLFYKQENYDRDVHKALFDEYGEKLIPFWNHTIPYCTDTQTVQTSESNWLQLKKYLLKTLKTQKKKQDVTQRKSYYNVMFTPVRSPVQDNKISILRFKSLPLRNKRTIEQSAYYYRPNKSESVDVITGRRTLLTLKKQFLTKNTVKSNGIMYTI